MSSNFNFIDENKLIDVKNACIEAEKGLSVTPATSAILSRRALELAVKWVYGVDKDLVDCSYDELQQYSLLETNHKIPLFS